MENVKKVSIIVPFYNVSKYLNQCLQSILNQTFKNFEVIMIDDGSTDASSEIATFFLNDDRFKLFKTKRVGISSCRNIGLKESSGEYISFIDSDDFVSENFLETLLSKIDNNDLIICEYFDYYEDFLEGFHHKRVAFDFIPRKNDLYDRTKISHEACVVPWNKLYKKQVFEKIQYKDSIVHEDEEIFQRIVFNSNKIKVIKDPLYYYRKKRSGSIMNSENNKSLLMGLEAIESRIEFYQSSSYKYGLNETIKDLYYCLLQNFNNQSFLKTDNYLNLCKLLKDIKNNRINRTSKVIINHILDKNFSLKSKRIRNRIFFDDLLNYIKNNSIFSAIKILFFTNKKMAVSCDLFQKKTLNLDSYYFLKKYKTKKELKQLDIYAKTDFESIVYDAISASPNIQINLFLENKSYLNDYQQKLIHNLSHNIKIKIIFLQ